jgi:hypothetical protein
MVQYPRLFAGADQIAKQGVEIQRMLFERLLQTGTGFDVGLDVDQEPRYRWIVMALAHDVEGLQQRHAGFHHGGELAREQGDVLFRNLAAASGALLLDRVDLDALAPQRGVDLGFPVGAYFAAHDFAGPVLAGPKVSEFLDRRALSCHCCSCHRTPLIIQSNQ